MRLPLLLALGCIAAPALAEPALEEPEGGAIPDDVLVAMRSALVEEVDLLDGKALAPRPAGIARIQMEAVAKRFPTSAEAQRYLGRAAFATGDVTAAETAYKSAVQLAADAPWALTQLADFYAARNDWKGEIAVLDRLAGAEKKDATADGKSALRTTWQRARDSAAAHMSLAGAVDPARYDRLLVELFPEDPSYLRRYIDGFLAAGKPDRALAECTRYKKLFPSELRYFAAVEASVAEARRDLDGAEGVYGALLTATPAPSAIAARDVDGLYDDYLDLLRRSGRLREFSRALGAKARSGRLAGYDLALAVHLHLHDGDRDQAKAILDAAAKSSAATGELLLRARLYVALGAPAAAVPILYEAFQKASPSSPLRPAGIASGKSTEQEEALGELGLALLTSDIGRTGLTPLAALDGFKLRHISSGPSVAGGLASLLFNGVHSSAAIDLDRVEAALGNGARAQSTLIELKRVAPRSPFVAALLRGLVDFRRAYRDDADAIHLADEFARVFPKDKQYWNVVRNGCDSRWRSGSAEKGAACYRRLLDEASRRGDSVEYDTTLRALTSAWEQADRQVEIVKLFWIEIGKHPGDPTLYDRFLEHTSRHNLFDEELKVYQQGAQRFATAAWYDRLARWHLRHKGKQAFRDLSEQLLTTASDSVAATYLDALVEWNRGEGDSIAFYETIYRHALERFPFDVRFARKLIAFYDANERDGAAQLCLRYSFFDAELRTRAIRERSSSGHLEGTVARIGRGRNVAERQFAATALVFLSRQEEAEPLLAAVAADFPGDAPLARRHAALWRAIGKPSARVAASQAAGMLDGLAKLFPADESLATEAGDYLSEAGLWSEAAKRYERIVAIRPGDPEAWLRLASIDWDYFHFDDAAAAIKQARKRSGDPLRFADKLAAIYESRKDFSSAISEYVRIVVGAQRLDVRPSSAPSDEQRSSDDGGEDDLGDSQVRVRDQDATATALSLLRILVKSRHLGAPVDKAWRIAIAGGDGRAILGDSAWLAYFGDEKSRRALLITEAGKTTDARLLERIVGDAGDAVEWRPVLIAALAREATLGKGAPAYVYPLAAALAADHRDGDAEKELVALIARLDAGGEDDRPESVDARVVYADFLARRKRWSEAITVRGLAADRASGDRKVTLELEVIDWRLERGDLDGAERSARALAASHPGEIRFARPVADALWRRGQRPEALAFLATEIAFAEKRRDLTDETRRALVGDLRHALIQRDDEAGHAREAVDQWIEIVNRKPDDRVEIGALHAYATEHALIARVTAYYEKTAKASSRDYRWPVVLAVLADLSGDPRGAATHLGEALLLSPDRIDLGGERAEALARAGDPAGAAAAYHRLWELTDRDPKWASSEATLLARAGKRAEAVAAIRRLVDADPAEPAAWSHAAEILERAGLLVEALDLAAKSIDKAGKNLRGQSLTREEAATFGRLAVRAGSATEGWTALDALEIKARAEAGAEGNPEPWRSGATADACHAAAADALPRAVADFATDGEARKFIEMIRARAQGDDLDRMASVAAAAGRPDVERELLRRGIARGGGVGDSYAARLQKALADAGQWRAIIQLVDEEHLADPYSLLALAHACRVLADGCEEGALKRYADTHPGSSDPLQWRFGERDPAIDRYLDLLVAGKREIQLAALARRGTYNGGQIADYFFAHGRPDLGDQAIAAAGSTETPAWRDAKQAVALLALGGHGAEARDLLGHILAPNAIGKSLGRKPDESREAIGRRWFRYAERFGDAIAQVGSGAGGRDEARRWYAAPVEDRPLDSSAYIEQGDALERSADHLYASAAYERALTLKPNETRAIDHLARAALAAGDRKRALATWDRVLGKTPSERTVRKRFDLVLAAGLVDEARAPFAEALSAQWKKSERIDDLRALAVAFPSHAAGSEWERFLRGLLDRSGWRDLPLLQAMVGRPGEPLLDRPAWEPYLRIGATQVSDGDAWIEALAEWGIKERHFSATLDAVAMALRVAADAAPPPWIGPDRARARAGLGDVNGAVAEIVEWSKGPGGDRDAAAVVLRELGSPLEWDVRVAFFRARAAVDHGIADEVGLADALLHKGRTEEASLLLDRLVVRRLDDEEAYRLAAECAERWKLTPLARDLRRRLAAIRPRDGLNRLALARDERDAGSPPAAVTIASALLADRGVEVAARRGAGTLLGELGRARIAGVREAIAAAAGGPIDEPIALAQAALADDGHFLTSSLGQLYAPRTALLALAKRAIRAGHHDEAARFLERLRALGAEGSGLSDLELRTLQLVEERVAGRPGAALASLADPAAAQWIDAASDEHGASTPSRTRALARIVAERNADLAQLPDGLGRQLVDAAVAAATDGGDAPMLAFYAALDDAIAPSPAARQRALEARATFDRARQSSARIYVTADIDDLSVAPAIASSPLSLGGNP